MHHPQRHSDLRSERPGLHASPSTTKLPAYRLVRSTDRVRLLGVFSRRRASEAETAPRWVVRLLEKINPEREERPVDLLCGESINGWAKAAGICRVFHSFASHEVRSPASW